MDCSSKASHLVGELEHTEGAVLFAVIVADCWKRVGVQEVQERCKGLCVIVQRNHALLPLAQGRC